MYGNTAKSDDADFCLWYFIHAEIERHMGHFYHSIDLVRGDLGSSICCQAKEFQAFIFRSVCFLRFLNGHRICILFFGMLHYSDAGTCC